MWIVVTCRAHWSSHHRIKFPHADCIFIITSDFSTMQQHDKKNRHILTDITHSFLPIGVNRMCAQLFNWSTVLFPFISIDCFTCQMLLFYHRMKQKIPVYCNSRWLFLSIQFKTFLLQFVRLFVCNGAKHLRAFWFASLFYSFNQHLFVRC